MRALEDGRVMIELVGAGAGAPRGRLAQRLVVSRTVWAQIERQPPADRAALVRHLLETAPGSGAV